MNITNLIKTVINLFTKRFLSIFSILAGLFVLGLIGGSLVFLSLTEDLPDYEQLAEYDPPTITRLYTSRGNVVAEYANERRIFTPFEEIPKLVINSFLAAEDKNFFQHQGIDPISIIRASAYNLVSLINDGKRATGGSTITQQVVKGFLLTSERTLSRKVKEAVLAYRINKAYSKERILELYLNQIFLGNNSFGIAAAAHNYFNKELNELDIAEVAMLAALPKAPSNLNPFKHYEKAKARRDWVIERMTEEDFISTDEAKKNIAKPINLQKPNNVLSIGDSFYSESVRKQLLDELGEKALYTKGLVVNINLDENLQKLADQSFRRGLIAYDRNHGWRGALANIDIKKSEWRKEFREFAKPSDPMGYDLAVVIKVKTKEAEIEFLNGHIGYIPFEKLSWARKSLNNQQLGPPIKTISEVLKEGDVILVSHYKSDKYYSLEQIPSVNGAMVVMQPYTGKVLALVGGYDFNSSYFNRAIQAKRQPGSTFKTFVYLSALESGFSSDDILLDAPISIKQGPGMPLWTPKNYKNNFAGEVTLAEAFTKSLNIPTIRLLMDLGIDKVFQLAKRLGIYNGKPKYANYAMALGAFETTLFDITNAYNIIASGGYVTTPKLIESIYDRRGNLIKYDDSIVCQGCNNWARNINEEVEVLPKVSYLRERAIKHNHNNKMISLLQEVVDHGTATRAKVIGKNIAGKTGTTNDTFDAWFIGFSTDFTVGVYVGFDTPRSLGAKENGSRVALPIFIDFMEKATKKLDNNELARVPESISITAINDKTDDYEHSFSSKPKIEEVADNSKQELEDILSNIDLLETDEDNNTNITPKNTDKIRDNSDNLNEIY